MTQVSMTQSLNLLPMEQLIVGNVYKKAWLYIYIFI